MDNYTTLVYVNITDKREEKRVNAEFNFDNKYEFHMSLRKNYLNDKDVLSVKKRESSMPENFWGDNISSLNVIAGRNGAGKTSVLQNVMDGNCFGNFDRTVFYILRHGNKYWYSGDYPNYRFRRDSSLEQINLEHQNLRTPGREFFWKNYIFYSNCFGSCYGRNFSNVIDISIDKWVTDIARRNYLSLKSEEYIIQKELKRELDERIFGFMCNAKLRKVAEKIGMHLPEWVIFEPVDNLEVDNLRNETNKFYEKTWVNTQRCKYKGYMSREDPVKGGYLQTESVYNYFVVRVIFYLFKEKVLSNTELKEFINLLSETIEETGLELGIIFLQQCIEKRENNAPQCKEGLEILKTLQNNGKGDRVLSSKGKVGFIIEICDENRKIIENLFNKKNYFLRCHLEYKDGSGMFSSGEKSRINLLVSLYESYKQLEKNTDNPSRSVLLIADEIDAYFHPQFQLSVVSDLVGAVNEIFQGYKVQILMTSNTPLEMTDIPNESITYMENGATIKYPVSEKTFAGNYISLLKNSFFTNSTMGDFAKQKINSVISFLKEQEVVEENMRKARCSRKKLEEVKYIISIIGEPILSNKLMQWYNELFPEECELND